MSAPLQVLAVVFLGVVLLTFCLSSLPLSIDTGDQHIHYKNDDGQGQQKEEADRATCRDGSLVVHIAQVERELY